MGNLKDSNGHIISGTSICVDYWVSSPEKKFDHFLTHLHADHTVGLNSSFEGTIYTSPFNCWLLQRWFKIKPEQIVVLTVGDTHIVSDRESNTFYSVTPFDANHCPGSVMFLFQGVFGNILYTGDFRYSPTMLDHPMLKSLIENEAVDTLYLDNTFAAENCEFPPRQEALKDLIKLVKEHPDHSILLGLRKLGKEEVLRALALEFKEKICVTSDKLAILKYLGYEDRLFTTQHSEARILVAQINDVNERFINKIRASKGPVISILLTAFYTTRPPCTKLQDTDTDMDNGIYKIPYSDHSCHSEIVKFVSEIKPKQLFPVVKINKKSKLYHCNVIPESILKFCINSETVEEIGQTSFKPGISVGAASGLKNNVISYTTKGHSVASLKTVEIKAKTAPALKGKECMSQNSSVDKKDESEIANEDPDLIVRSYCSPRVSLEELNQDVQVSQKVIQSPFETALSNQLSSQEYFTLSDEELSQKHVLEQQVVPNKSSEQASSTSDVDVNTVQKGLINKCLKSNVINTLGDCDSSPNNQTVIPNKVPIASCVSLLTDTSQFISKHSLKPILKPNATTSMEEVDQEYDKCVSSEPSVMPVMRKEMLIEKTVHGVNKNLTDQRMFQTNEKVSKKERDNRTNDQQNVLGNIVFASRVISPEKYPVMSFSEALTYSRRRGFQSSSSFPKMVEHADNKKMLKQAKNRIVVEQTESQEIVEQTENRKIVEPENQEIVEQAENQKMVERAENRCHDYEKIRNLVLRSKFHSKMYKAREDLPFQKIHLNHDQKKMKDLILNKIFHSKQTTCTPAQVTKQNEEKEEDESDKTVSDLEENCVTLEMFEKMDKKNDQIQKVSRACGSTSVSKKFHHLLVNGTRKESFGSGFFPPAIKKNSKKTKSKMSVQTKNEKMVLTNDKTCYNKRNRSETKAKYPKDQHCNPPEKSSQSYESNYIKQNIHSSSKSNVEVGNKLVKLNCSTSKKHDGQNYTSREEKDLVFYKNLVPIYKRWKQQTMKNQRK
ncbi:uncharacterized protein LOC128992602 [Macrosteles quadrilineatus]|uniref:uncharacterized protein LOC128992602 n=1 Tax=Macrosteles quadrilineatus TaxID=74068 RepID=UPI0023E163F0|nr:uncharacterized protein LOC128992602 [Macrosteles quadrilineatus]XP_054272236.1 uncharacterized protein LOC128992602 [Macrosteles quadrilineatus]